MQVFEFQRRAITDAAVQAAHVVPSFEEPEDTCAGLLVGREVFTHQQFCFERAEERLTHRIVIGIADCAHRRLYARLAATPPEGNGRVLGGFNRSSQHL